jgi:hypothetical protein
MGWGWERARAMLLSGETYQRREQPWCDVEPKTPCYSVFDGLLKYSLISTCLEFGAQ